MPVWEMRALSKPSARADQESPPVGAGEEYYYEEPLLARASEPPGPGGEGAAEYYECHPRAGALREYPPAGAVEDEDPLAAGGERRPRTSEELLADIAGRLLARGQKAGRRYAGARSKSAETRPQPSCGPRLPALRPPPQRRARVGPTERPRGSVGRMVVEKARPPPTPALPKARPPPPPVLPKGEASAAVAPRRRRPGAPPLAGISPVLGLGRAPEGGGRAQRAALTVGSGGRRPSGGRPNTGGPPSVH